MGLTTLADAPEGKIKKSDVTVTKNYLSQDRLFMSDFDKYMLELEENTKKWR